MTWAIMASGTAAQVETPRRGPILTSIRAPYGRRGVISASGQPKVEQHRMMPRTSICPAPMRARGSLNRPQR